MIKWIKFILTTIYAFLALNVVLIKMLFQGFKIPAVKYDSKQNKLDISRQRKSFKETIFINQMILEIDQRNNLLTLDISGLSLQGKDFIAIFQCLQKQSAIHTVDLSRNQLGAATDEMITKLAETISACKSLAHINFSENRMNNAQCIYLADKLIKNLPRLAKIDLSMNLVNDEGAATLAKQPVTIVLQSNSLVRRETTAALATEFHETIIESCPPPHKNLSTFKLNKHTNPVKLCEFWRKNGVNAAMPSLVQLCVFKVKSSPECMKESSRLPAELQAELRRNVIF